MNNKKVCMLGASAAGKTSLTRRFVHSIFSDEYHSTIGVKIDKKNLLCNNQKVSLIIWDIQGEKKYRKVMSSYFKGMEGYLLVVDSCRLETIAEAVDLHDRAVAIAGVVPFVLVLNKCDLMNDWTAVEQQSAQLQKDAIAVVRTSAKTGESVEQAFGFLTENLFVV